MIRKIRNWGCGLILAASLTGASYSLAVAQDDAAQAAKDARVVETLSRLANADPNSNPKWKAAIIRHLDRNKGTKDFVSVASKFKIAEAKDHLLELALAQPEAELGVSAARALADLGQSQLLADALNNEDEKKAIAAAKVIAMVGNREATDRLVALLSDAEKLRAVRNEALSGLLRSNRGRQVFIELIEAGKLPKDLEVFAAGAVVASNNAELRNKVTGKLQLPKTADATPLPSLPELVQSKGKVDLGKEVFIKKGTCANCHVVSGEGKGVGPDLTEIGSKLSREAMFISILDPSAGISHNFETYIAESSDGELVTGILVSETEEKVTLKTAEAIERVFEKADLESYAKQSVSLMPQGLQANLTAEELISLVDYLETLKKKQ